jgi:hypothetical protein
LGATGPAGAGATGATGAVGATGSGGGGGGGGSILGHCFYQPTTLTSESIPSTFGPIDSTNLTVSFKTNVSGPGSTEVIAVLTAAALTQTSGYYQFWGLTDHTSGSQYGLSGIPQNNSGSNNGEVVSLPFLITGLSPNTNYQMDWSAFSGGSSSLQIQGRTGGGWGGTYTACPASMIVYSGTS